MTISTKQVRIIGDNTKIKLQPGSGTAFKVTGFGGESRIETLVFEGSDTTTLWPSNGEIGLDLQGGRVIVDQCTFAYLDVGGKIEAKSRADLVTDPSRDFADLKKSESELLDFLRKGLERALAL